MFMVENKPYFVTYAQIVNFLQYILFYIELLYYYIEFYIIRVLSKI